MADRWFLSLGAGQNQLPLIMAAKALGFQVACVDADAVGREFADRFYCASILNRRNIIDIITTDSDLSSSLCGVGCRSFAKAVEVAASVSRHFSLPSNPHTALRFFRDKSKYKKKLQQWQIPVPFDVQNPKKLIVRPATGFAKEGLQIIDTAKASEESTSQTLKDMVSAGHFVEPFIDGNECILLGLVSDGTFYPVIITDRIRNSDFSDQMHVFPSSVDAKIRYDMAESCRQIVRRSGLLNGPFLAEFIVSNGVAYLVECAAEVGGEFLADDMVPLATRLPYFELLVKILTKTDPDGVRRQLLDHLEKERQSAMVIGYLPPSEDGNDTEASQIEFSAAVYRHAGFLFARQLSVRTANRPNNRRPGVIGLSAEISKRQQLIDDMKSIIANHKESSNATSN